MSRCFNKVILIGIVASEPEFKKSPGGVSLLTFRIMTSESFKTADGRIVDRTDWFSIVTWRNLADVSKKIVRKGARIFVEGVLRSRDVQLRSGEKVQKIEVVAENILLLDGKKNNNKKDVSNYYAVGDDIELPDFLNDLEKI
ncbi:MAG: hypothetical protein CH6_4477 [Candidatus Kapaibacterium sp.]|nr:MAG: hypothetical protein CH6_4477 [Candidatus Kapabacteria bacterium]